MQVRNLETPASRSLKQASAVISASLDLIGSGTVFVSATAIGRAVETVRNAFAISFAEAIALSEQGGNAFALAEAEAEALALAVAEALASTFVEAESNAPGASVCVSATAQAEATATAVAVVIVQVNNAPLFLFHLTHSPQPRSWQKHPTPSILLR